MGGWLEKVNLKLNSTQVVVEVEVRVELGKNENLHHWQSSPATATPATHTYANKELAEFRKFQI